MKPSVSIDSKVLGKLTPTYSFTQPTYTSTSTNDVVESNKSTVPIINYHLPKAVAYQTRQQMDNIAELYEKKVLPRVQIYYMK